MRPSRPLVVLAMLAALALPVGAAKEATLADLGGVSLSVDRLSATTKPQESAVFEMVLDAEEGARRRVTFEVVQATDGFLATPPAPVTLPGPGGPTALVPFMVLMSYRNGYVDDPGTVVLRVTSSPVGDGQGETVTHDVTFEVRSRGMYVPGPGAALVAPLLAAVALAASRTRP